MYDTVLFRLPTWAWSKTGGRFIGAQASVPSLDDTEVLNDSIDEHPAFSSATANNVVGENRRRGKATVRRRPWSGDLLFGCPSCMKSHHYLGKKACIVVMLNWWWFRKLSQAHSSVYCNRRTTRNDYPHRITSFTHLWCLELTPCPQSE